jgi:hypothetical protein
MRVQHVGYRIRGFYRLADYALRWGMIAKDAQRRLEILGFWRGTVWPPVNLNNAITWGPASPD